MAKKKSTKRRTSRKTQKHAKTYAEQSTKKNERHFFGALENQEFSTRLARHSKGATFKAPVKKILSAVTQGVQQAKQALTPPERVEVHLVKKTLGKAPEEYHFVLHDGRKLKSLYELVDELETMSEEAFKDYVTEVKNDFANWTKDVFHAPELADELYKIKNKFESQRAIMKHLLRDVQSLVQDAVHQKTEQSHHTKEDKKKHDKLTGCTGGRCHIR